jgi:hypothetical protein
MKNKETETRRDAGRRDASTYEPEGQRFESSRAYQSLQQDSDTEGPAWRRNVATHVATSPPAPRLFCPDCAADATLKQTAAGYCVTCPGRSERLPAKIRNRPGPCCQTAIESTTEKALIAWDALFE